MKESRSNSISRRDFVRQAGVLATAAPIFPGILNHGQGTGKQTTPLKIHLFSKHLQFLDYNAMAEKAAEAGFDGIDLTVRSRGHVEPERVEQDLPKAVKAIHEAGMKSIIMATNVTGAKDELGRRVLETAAQQGITLYRMEHYKYLEGKTIPQSIEHYQVELNELSELNEKIGIMGCYQNHAGTRMGSSVWELYAMLMESNKGGLGAQYDIRHATVEGGLNWPRGLQLIHPWIQSIAIKDFRWAEEDGEWQPQNVPFGEGMVDWKSYFALLKSYHIDVPVSLHMEYPLGGAEKGSTEISVDPQVVYGAMIRDLDNVRKLWQEA